MTVGDAQVGQARSTNLADLVAELRRLRRQAARTGPGAGVIRALAARARRAPSTPRLSLDGEPLRAADVYDDMLCALGVPSNRLRPLLDAWERMAEGAVVRGVQ